MRDLTGELLVLAISSSVAAGRKLLDQDFWRPRSEEVVKLNEEHGGNTGTRDAKRRLKWL